MEEKRTDPLQLMKIYSCFAWHSLDDIEGGVTAPVLDQAILVPRVMDRLGSNPHVQSVTKAVHSGHLGGLGQKWFKPLQGPVKFVGLFGL